MHIKDTESHYMLDSIVRVEGLGTCSPQEIDGKADLYLYRKALANYYRADEQDIMWSGQPLVGKVETSQDGEDNRRRRWCRRPPRCSYGMTTDRSWGS